MREPFVILKELEDLIGKLLVENRRLEEENKIFREHIDNEKEEVR